MECDYYCIPCICSIDNDGGMCMCPWCPVYDAYFDGIEDITTVIDLDDCGVE